MVRRPGQAAVKSRGIAARCSASFVLEDCVMLPEVLESAAAAAVDPRALGPASRLPGKPFGW
jgi:hypothetical protein